LKEPRSGEAEQTRAQALGEGAQMLESPAGAAQKLMNRTIYAALSGLACPSISSRGLRPGLSYSAPSELEYVRFATETD